ncbi:serine/threonine-protein kinase [Polyangium sp. y55x31]|uniref:serine/threonine-protein kinase n=1 Tax=Polyangium sp. y55x31 TaxID=3042688 RepID=UPI002482B006|nr:serine/threonine-protein kinase [Polyangium sp. y55x31]MDI1483651.1 serine/threonine-protein kinase [Polyangium sp. y55x31]
MSSDSEIELPVKAGDVIAGKYRVDRVLGVGGMGAVVAAEHTELEQRVAIKFMLEAAAKNEVGKKRFLREAQAATKLRSEHVTRMLDFGTLDDGVPYLVMELLEGRDLDEMIRAAGKLPIEEACEVVLQTCEALAEAHGRGIVHRDIKPANLFVTRRADGSPAVKVLDFGIAKHQDLAAIDGTALTRSNALLGSPMYMSLEQFRAAREVDARSDIWSLGVVLYKALTGVMPFVADSLGALIMVLMTEDPEPPGRHREDLPPELGEVVLRCLQKEPAGRFQTVAELADALAPFVPERSRALLDRIHAHLAAPREAQGSLPEAPAGKTGNTSPGQTTGSSLQKKERSSGGTTGDGARPSGGGERVSTPPMGKTASTWSQTQMGAPSRSGKWFVLTGAVALLLGIVGARLLGGREEKAVTAEPPRPPAIEAPAPAATPTPAPSATVAAPAKAPEATAAPPTASASVAPSASVAAPKAAAPVKTGTTKPAATGAPSAAPTTGLVPDFGGRK